uniref:Uncharacterized protein n=1 Tax=Cacopsylla melanoneura TaxID=428564 RepID=A0A8D8RPH7_9HEMI
MFDAPQPAPSIQSEPSRASFNLGLGAQSATPSVTKVPSRTRSSGGQSSTFSGTDTNSLADNNNMFNAPQNHYIGKSTPNKFESCKNIGVEPRPEIKYGADGRRLAGKQNEKWPVKGGKYNITFSSNLGPTFQGILIPQNTIDLLEQRFRNYTRDSTKDVDNLELGNVQTKKADFQIGFPPEWEQQIDIALINQAIRQAQGDYDDWDKPDPWTYASIYSKDVLELNKKLLLS